MEKLRCCVIGSINMDMVVKAARFPLPGESLIGSSFVTVPGGKGANQAVALARLGVDTLMAGAVGDDMYGKEYLAHLAGNGVDTAGIRVVPGVSTGVAAITVTETGENSIVVAPGANRAYELEWLNELLALAKDRDIFLFQLEITTEVIYEAIRRLRALGKTIILDPAPAHPLPKEILALVDIVTPNETELKQITSELPEEATGEMRMAHLLRLGVKAVVNKSGSKGAYVLTAEGQAHLPGFKVRAVDTTAAGDTFNAGLAAGLSRGWPLERCVLLGNAAAAISVTKLGAQGGMPSFDEAMALLLAREENVQ